MLLVTIKDIEALSCPILVETYQVINFTVYLNVSRAVENIISGLAKAGIRHWSHKPEIVGSNPTLTTKSGNLLVTQRYEGVRLPRAGCTISGYSRLQIALVVQKERVFAFEAIRSGFKSQRGFSKWI